MKINMQRYFLLYNNKVLVYNANYKKRAEKEEDKMDSIISTIQWSRSDIEFLRGELFHETNISG